MEAALGGAGGVAVPAAPSALFTSLSRSRTALPEVGGDAGGLRAPDEEGETTLWPTTTSAKERRMPQVLHALFPVVICPQPLHCHGDLLPCCLWPTKCQLPAGSRRQSRVVGSCHVDEGCDCDELGQRQESPLKCVMLAASRRALRTWEGA